MACNCDNHILCVNIWEQMDDERIFQYKSLEKSVVDFADGGVELI